MSPIEWVVLALSVAMTVVSFLYYRSRKDAYRSALLVLAFLKVEAMRARDQAELRAKLQSPPQNPSP